MAFGVLIFVTGCPNDVNTSKNSQNSQMAQTQDKGNTAKLNAEKVNSDTDKNRQSTNSLSCNNAAINQAYQAQNPNNKRQVLGCGNIIKVLKDDNDGSRHQKFLVKIDNYPKVTVLNAHNIDLAPRVKDIQANTPIRFYGEYIYNNKGGVIHWTHKDPASRHQDGWLAYQGQKYQ